MPHRALVCLLDMSAIDDARLASYEAWLSDGERARLARFVRAERRRQFVAGRILLRQMLAPLLDCAPSQIALCERPGQAPLLEREGDPAGAPFFSVSHSGAWVACAISSSTPVGLDVERIDPGRDVAALAAHVFDEARQAALAALPEPDRLATFYHLWCEAEAEYKLGEPAGFYNSVPHHSLAIALCSRHPLQAAPAVRLARLQV